jgi:Domain of unknown function (DUF1906)
VTIALLDSDAAVNPDAAIAAGYGGILRYLDNGDNAGSCLSATEVATYTAAGFGIGSLWERSPTAAAGGYNQGLADGEQAVAAAEAVGQPKLTAIYAAVDTDPASLSANAIELYFRGFSLKVRIAGYYSGAYLGAAVANQCWNARIIDRVMIPGAKAWSDGASPLAVDIQQTAATVDIDGVTCDIDYAPVPETAGLWTSHGPWPVPKPATPVQEDDVNDTAFLVKGTKDWRVVDPGLKSAVTLPDGDDGTPLVKAGYRTLDLDPAFVDALPESK